MSAKFEAAKTYSTRSVCDHDCIISMTVIRRTEKTIRVRLSGDREKTLRVKPDYCGNESVKPWGSYSMCPVISADRVAA